MFSDGIEGDFKGSGGMGFVDFIYFMLSEEDKTTDTSLAYWYLSLNQYFAWTIIIFLNLFFRFKCCDFDSEGVITTEKMRHLFRHQLNRLALMV